MTVDVVTTVILSQHAAYRTLTIKKKTEKYIKTDIVLSQRIITNSLQTSGGGTDNPVHKLTTDMPQPVLINVLIRAIF